MCDNCKKCKCMNDFKTRLEKEESELSERIHKLFTFSCGSKFNDVEPAQKTLLRIQLQAMKTYHICLMERLSLLNDGDIQTLDDGENGPQNPPKGGGQ